MANTSSTHFIAILILFSAITRSNQYVLDDDICKSTVEVQGYVYHEHRVTNEDGYILSLQRILKSKFGLLANKPPVFLQHGTLVDGLSWLLNPPNQSLPLILADDGYDVWIANSRGTKYSRRHVSLNSPEKSYWEWSWDELAAYDLPASIQFAYNQTGQQKLHYVGHSLGTLTALAVFSQGKLVNMIRSAVLLSPIAHLNHIPAKTLKTAAEKKVAEEEYRLEIRDYDIKGRGQGIWINNFTFSYIRDYGGLKNF